MQWRINEKKCVKKYEEPFFFIIIMTIYLFFSLYEGYILILSSTTRWFLIFMIGYFIMFRKKIIIQRHQVLIICWYIYYFISLSWTSPDALNQAKLYIYTITSMVLLFFFLAGIRYSEDFVMYLIKIYQILSGMLGVCALFSNTMIGAGTRKVLVIFGKYMDPNNQVALFAIGTAISLNNLFCKKGKNKIIDIMILGINSYGILMTGSRSGIVILFVQIILVLLWKSKEQKWRKYIGKWALIILGIFVMYCMIKQYLPQEVFERLFGLGNLKFTDGTERELKWATGLEIWKTHPIFGCGWGSYESHNTFLTFLIDTGIFGTVFIFITIIDIGIKALKKKSILAILMMFTGLIPAFFIGAQNKRFFWNSLIIPVIIISTVQNKKIDMR